MRYPIDDPRLAELNWKMDQMLEAGEEYLEKNFKENKNYSIVWLIEQRKI